MTYIRIDKMEDGSIAFDTSEGMTKDEAVHMLEIAKNEAAFSPPDIWPEAVAADTAEVASEGE